VTIGVSNILTRVRGDAVSILRQSLRIAAHWAAMDPGKVQPKVPPRALQVAAWLAILTIGLVGPIAYLSTPPGDRWFTLTLAIITLGLALLLLRAKNVGTNVAMFGIVAPALLIVFLLTVSSSFSLDRLAPHFVISGGATFGMLYLVVVFMAFDLVGYRYGIAAGVFAMALVGADILLGRVTGGQAALGYMELGMLAIVIAVGLYYTWRQHMMQQQIHAVNSIALALYRQETPTEVARVMAEETLGLTQAEGVTVYQGGMFQPIASCGIASTVQPEREGHSRIVTAQTDDASYTMSIVRPLQCDSDILQTLQNHLQLALQRAYIGERMGQILDEQTKTLREAYLGIMDALVQMLEQRDYYTAGHSARVAAYARALAQEMGVGPADIEIIGTAGLIHDIGKVAIPDGILLQPRPLTEDEWAVMRQHPVIGADIIERVPGLQPYVPAVRHHHERWDGDGYPDRLAGEQIPLMARILAVADAFDAMTTDRAYHKARSAAAACAVLRQGAGVQWDPLAAETMANWLAQRGYRLDGEQEATGS